MAKRKKLKKIYSYKCVLSKIPYKTTKEAAHPNELLSVDAYYELHPEEDQRPEVEKIKRKQAFESLKAKFAQLEEEGILEEVDEERS